MEFIGIFIFSALVGAGYTLAVFIDKPFSEDIEEMDLESTAWEAVYRGVFAFSVAFFVSTALGLMVTH